MNPTATSQVSTMRVGNDLEAPLAAFEAATAALDRARDDLHAVIRRHLDDGVSAYRISKLTGLSERHVGRIRHSD